jgi:hypothetical protein
MWTFDLTTGWLYEQGKPYVKAKTQGKIPEGLYTMSQAFDDPKGGPMVLRLEPAPVSTSNNEKGEYLVFGGNKGAQGIILPHVSRAYINASPDRHLTVTTNVGSKNPPIREHIVI